VPAVTTSIGLTETFLGPLLHKIISSVVMIVISRTLLAISTWPRASWCMLPRIVWLVITALEYLAQVVARMMARGIDRLTVTSINYLVQVVASILLEEAVCHVVTTITYPTQKVTVVLTHDVNDERGMQLALVEPTVVKQVLMHALLL